jgi:hypothetical protein
MNLATAFVDYLETLSLGTFGDNIFIGLAPSSNLVPDAIFWIVASGGTATRNASGGTMSEYTVDIYYRDTSYETVYDTLNDLQENLNCDSCVELDGFDTIDISAFSYPIDQDLDNEDRKVGLLQATVRAYADCIINIS